MKVAVHMTRMEEVTVGDEGLPLEIFEKTYARLSKAPGAKYKFIMEAGCSLKPALFNLCDTIWRTETLPSRWSESILIQLYKGSGSRNLLRNHRFIHTKEEFPKFFGNLVMTAARDTLVNNMSKFQIGAKPGHRAQEHLFVLKSVLSLYLTFDKAVILSTWDISRYFDAECLTDVMNELHKNEIKGKLYRLIYMMNKNTRIRVQTPVGLTHAVDTGEGLGQGTIEGAIASAINLDNGVSDFFADSDDEIHYLGAKLGPLLFQDDVARLSLDVASAQRGNDRMLNVAETKLLNFNISKSCYTIFGSK